MDAPTPHILFSIMLGLVGIAGITTAMAFVMNENTRSLGVFIGITFITLLVAQIITTGYSEFGNVPYWWILLIIAGVGLLLSVWQCKRMPRKSLLNKEFWQQWRRAFWMLFGVMFIVGVLKSLFRV
ncbi:MAG TPA: hypothetical protein VFO38_04605 [Candidatus Saccharimonadales bacterium]|nr:hypothetical protein [Candidatus Saccharimonadales bacterium]